jgi:hypothetical protein
MDRKNGLLCVRRCLSWCGEAWTITSIWLPSFPSSWHWLPSGRTGVPDPDWIRIHCRVSGPYSDFESGIQFQESQNDPHKKEKLRKLWFEELSEGLEVPLKYERPLFGVWRNTSIFSSDFILIVVIVLDPDSGMPGFGPGSRFSGSEYETLSYIKERETQINRSLVSWYKVWTVIGQGPDLCVPIGQLI